MSEAEPRVTIDPPARAWADMLGRPRTGDRESVDRFRRELGLPVGPALIMTGHQSAFWHPGILAKHLAADAAARELGAGAAWLVADQDEHEFGSLRVPVRDAEDRLKAESVKIAIGEAPAPGVAAASCPPFDPADGAARTGRAALPSVASGLNAVVSALSRHRGEANAARQVVAAVRELLEGLVEPRPVVFATELTRTTLFREILERMAREGVPMARVYNRAVARFPGAGMTALRIEGEHRAELPLWRLERGGRRRVFSDEAGLMTGQGLAPRALLTTGLARLAGCDLFIHGTGGGAYDPVTEAWLGEWLGAGLAPVAVVTADLRLPLHERPVTPSDLARARWRAHHARHDPGLIGDAEAAREKRELVRMIGAARAAGRDPAPHFARMHAILSCWRASHSGDLDRLEREARGVRAMLEEAAIAHDRTWAFPLHDASALRALRAEIEGRFARPGRDQADGRRIARTA